MSDRYMENPEVMEGLEDAGIEFAPINAIEAITRGEVDIQISTAKRFPRSLANFYKRAEEMIGTDIDTAEKCIYKLPRGRENGKPKIIEGESIRLAEIVAVTYGNIRSGARIISIEPDFVVAQSVVHDVETNVAFSTETRRSIIDRNKKRYNVDMIVMTCNAAASIALRNSVFRVVPKAMVKRLVTYAKSVAIGDIKTLPERREKAIKYFNNLKVTTASILEFLDCKGIEEIGLEDLETLTGIKTAFGDGDIKKLEEVFAPVGGTGKPITDTRKPDIGNTPQKQEEVPPPPPSTDPVTEPTPAPISPEAAEKEAKTQKEAEELFGKVTTN